MHFSTATEPAPGRSRRRWAAGLALAAALLSGPTARAYTFLGAEPTKWDAGLNTASTHGFVAPEGPRSPGAASWSAMPSGVPFADVLGGSEEASGGGRHPDGDVSTDVEFLLTPEVDGLEYSIIEAALNTWAAASNFTNLGRVDDAATILPPGAVGDLESLAGHLGDIRVGSFSFVGDDPDLVETFQPGTEAIYGPGGTIAGDVHFNRDVRWVDDPLDPTAGDEFDFYTVALHELGHALGLGHSDEPLAVMYEFYDGSRRTLHADDVAGIQALYGPAAVPEPATLALAAIGLLAGVTASGRSQTPQG